LIQKLTKKIYVERSFLLYKQQLNQRPNLLTQVRVHTNLKKIVLIGLGMGMGWV